MSVYNPRRAPNVSQYIDDLNQIPPTGAQPQQQPQQQQQRQGQGQGQRGQEEFDFEGSLAMFTNAEFPDFDLGDTGNEPVPFDPSLEGQAGKDAAGANANDGMSFSHLFNSDLNIPGFTDYPAYPLMQSGLAQNYHNGAQNIQSPTTSSPLSQSSPATQQYSQGAKRKADSQDVAIPTHQNSSGSLEDQSRLAAEEDKRRRNTAASARFRVKKKEREKALERSVKEVTDKNSKLEQRMSQLEMENKWLRNLITEKSGSKNEVDITEMWKKFRRESEEREKAGKDQKDGVGTDSDVKNESS